MKTVSKHNQVKQNQQGLVSIMVVMIIMGIIVLVSVSFAFLMRREQRQALDRVLSTSAFYAAESGVHDAAAQINSLSSNTDCGTTPGKAAGTNVLSPVDQDDVSYTCVLVNKNPDEVVKDPVDTDTSFVIRLESGSGPITQIDIGWQDSVNGGVGTSFATNSSHYLPQNGVTGFFNSSTGTGIVQASIMPIRSSAVNGINRANLVSDARTYFLYPKGGVAGAAANSVGYANDAQFVDGGCNNNHPNKTTHPNFCNIHITGVGNNSGVVYLRLKAIYRPVAVNVRIHTASGQVPILNAQAVIDSTGKARDVLRRIQVRVPLSGDYLFPEEAITSLDSICKRIGFPGTAPNTPFLLDLPREDNTPNLTGGIFYNKTNVDDRVCDPTQP